MERATMAATNLVKGGGVLLLCSSSAYSSSSSCSSSSLTCSQFRRRMASFSLGSPPYPNIKKLPPSHSLSHSHSLSLSLCLSLSSTTTTTTTTTTSIRRRRSLFSSFCTIATDNNTPAENQRENQQQADQPQAQEEEEAVKAVKEAADLLDIRVGRILKAWRHEEADSLYVEEVDVGEPHPRLICSGLVNYIPLHLLQDARVVVLVNLKPRNMRGVKSSGMLMAASDGSHSHVELLVPPEGSIPGDRIWFGSPLQQQLQPQHQHQPQPQHLPPPASPNQIQKKKMWELVQPHLKTDDSCVATLLGEHAMRTCAGVVFSTCLKNAIIS